jgi:hypothetical protein
VVVQDCERRVLHQGRRRPRDLCRLDLPEWHVPKQVTPIPPEATLAPGGRRRAGKRGGRGVAGYGGSAAGGGGWSVADPSTSVVSTNLLRRSGPKGLSRTKPRWHLTAVVGL